MNHLEKIKQLVGKLNLSSREIDGYLDLFKNNPSYGEKIVDFWEMKIDAVRLNDKNLWTKICQKEFKFLDKISTSVLLFLLINEVLLLFLKKCI